METGMRTSRPNTLNINFQSEVPSKSKFLVKGVDRKHDFLNTYLDRKLPGRPKP